MYHSSDGSSDGNNTAATVSASAAAAATTISQFYERSEKYAHAQLLCNILSTYIHTQRNELMRETEGEGVGGETETAREKVLRI